MPETKITTLLIEKNPKELKELHSFIKKSEYLSVIGSALTGKKAFSIIANAAPELVFINIDLQDINGLDFVRVLHSRNIFPDIVFTAGDQQSAYNALEFEPLDFLVKPYKKEDFLNLTERLKNKRKKNELLRKMDLFAQMNAIPPKHTFKLKTGIINLDLAEIVFIKAARTLSELTLISGEKVVVRSSINTTIETIDSENFIRTNRSFCINRNYLHKVEKSDLKCIMQADGKRWKVPVSKNILGQLEKTNIYPVL